MKHAHDTNEQTPREELSLEERVELELAKRHTGATPSRFTNHRTCNLERGRDSVHGSSLSSGFRREFPG